MTDRHRDAVAQRYASIARLYERYWAPLLHVHAAPLLAELAVARGERVLDLGCGTGAIGAALGQGGARVVGIDLAHAALRRAARAGLAVARADMTATPLRDGAFDAVVSTFVLQHAPRPGRAIAEAARVLRPGGRCATATWGPESGEEGGPYEVVARALRRHRIPEDAAGLRTWHHLVDSPARMRRYARAAGLEPVAVWMERSSVRWTPRRFLAWATTMGPFGRRLASATPRAREAVRRDITDGLASLPRDAFVWRPEVVYMIAAR